MKEHDTYQKVRRLMVARGKLSSGRLFASLDDVDRNEIKEAIKKCVQEGSILVTHEGTFTSYQDPWFVKIHDAPVHVDVHIHDRIKMLANRKHGLTFADVLNEIHDASNRGMSELVCEGWLTVTIRDGVRRYYPVGVPVRNDDVVLSRFNYGLSRGDKKVYRFTHTEIEPFVGTFPAFSNVRTISRASLCNLRKGRVKTCAGWSIDYDFPEYSISDFLPS